MQRGNAQRLLESQWAILTGFRKAAGKCLNTRCQPIGEEVELRGRSSYHLRPEAGAASGAGEGVVGARIPTVNRGHSSLSEHRYRT
jgi:hypothetical protein